YPEPAAALQQPQKGRADTTHRGLDPLLSALADDPDGGPVRHHDKPPTVGRCVTHVRTILEICTPSDPSMALLPPRYWKRPTYVLGICRICILLLYSVARNTRPAASSAF